MWRSLVARSAWDREAAGSNPATPTILGDAMAREYTMEEVREIFLRHVHHLIDYWEDEGEAVTSRDRLEGLAHSLLAMLDGCSADAPGFIVAPLPHKDDKERLESLGENWYPENDETLVNCDIGGALHDLFYKYKE